MKKMLVVIVMCMFLIGVVGEVIAASTAAEAEAMVKKAAAYIKTNGKDKALKEFTDGTQFKKDDLYIFVLDLKCLTLAHGGNPKLVGKDMAGLKDANGKLVIKDIVDGAKTKGSGWSDYKWTNPVSKKIEDKSTYYMMADGMVIGCGVYKK
jgi:cytochrome c